MDILLVFIGIVGVASGLSLAVLNVVHNKPPSRELSIVAVVLIVVGFYAAYKLLW